MKGVPDVLLCIAFVFNNNDSHPSTQHPVSCNASICMNACTLPIHLRIITARYLILCALTGFSIWDWNDGATSFVPRLWHSCWDAWLKILANTGQSQLRHESVIHCATITMYWRKLWLPDYQGGFKILSHKPNAQYFSFYDQIFFSHVVFRRRQNYRWWDLSFR